jgi:hypothetical protein
MRRKKERRGLGFRISIEFLNLVFDSMKKRKYKLIPEDAQIYAIRHEDMMYNSYTIVIKSKEFPIVSEGCECNRGDIHIDKEKGIIKLKELENEYPH